MFLGAWPGAPPPRARAGEIVCSLFLAGLYEAVKCHFYDRRNRIDGDIALFAVSGI